MGRIKTYFDSHSYIEVSVLNEQGDDQIVLYRGEKTATIEQNHHICLNLCAIIFPGNPSQLKLKYLSTALVAPGCFYMLNVNAILIQEWEAPKIVATKEICWITGS